MERALLDLMDLGCEDAIKNQLVIRSLPDGLKERWLLYRCDAASGVNPHNRFDKLWQFLRDQKTVLVQLEQLQIAKQPNSARAGDMTSKEKVKVKTVGSKAREAFLHQGYGK